MLRKVQQSGAYSMQTHDALEDYDLGWIDCPECNNTGTITVLKDGYLYSRECDCMAKRRAMRRIRKSNMTDLLNRYTFDEYKTPDEETRKIKKAALQFVKDTGWLYIAGQSGSGKTHICTAICSSLINSGIDVYYMSWRDESTSLKAIINTDEYKERIEVLKKIPVLYIDDFFKGGTTEADIRLAFEMINQRYNDSKLRTIISSEYGIETILSKDEALGGRIYERCKNYLLKAPRMNWRLTQ